MTTPCLWNPSAPSYAMANLRFADRVKRLVGEGRVEVIVETGVNVGKSTLAFALLNGPRVVGIDVDPVCIGSAWGMLVAAHMLGAKIRNDWTLCVGDSADVLKRTAPTLPERTLYFLDAHWQMDRWPILDEIDAIPRGSGILALHDFGTPGHEASGHSQPGTHDRLTYEYVRGALTRWSPAHRVEYDDPQGEYVGVAWVYSR